MTMYDLIQKLTDLADECGYECNVIDMDGEGEFPFSVRLELEQYQWKPKLTIGIDTTAQQLRGDAEQ